MIQRQGLIVFGKSILTVGLEIVKPSLALLVLHTLAYLRGTLPLGLKGRFYAIVAFVYLMGTFYSKQMV